MHVDEKVRFVRSMIEQENALLNQRMTWTLTAQAVLLAGAGAIWEKSRLVVLVIGIIGVVASVSLWVAVHEADRALDLLNRAWGRYRAADYDGPSPIPLEEAPTSRLAWLLLPWNVLPWVLFLSWIIIVAIRLLNAS